MSRPPRILIVTSGPLTRNPRPWKEAGCLAEAGYDVTVFTVANQKRIEAFDRELMQGAAFRKQAIDHLAARGASRVAALGERGLTWLARRSLRVGWNSAAAFGPVARMRRRALRHGADLTIVHTELGLAVGSALLAHGRRVAVDIEDWHSHDLLPTAQRTRPLRLLERFEAEVLRRCVYATTTSRSLAEALSAAYAAPLPHVVRNVFPLQPAPPLRPPPDVPTFLWFSQTVGPGRMIELFLAAWGESTRASRVCLLGEVTPGYRTKLLQRLPPDRRKDLYFCDLVSPRELPSVIAGYDIGLALEARVPDSRDLTITNKFFQYLNAGLPVVATPTAGQREVLEETPNIGWSVDLTQTTEATAALDAIVAEPGRIRSTGEAARRAAEARYCWERESAQVIGAVRSVLGT